MTILETAAQQSQLLGRLVLNRETTEEMGRVHQFWLDSSQHCVVAFTAKSGLLGRHVQWFKWEQVTAIGEDSLLLVPIAESLTQPPVSSDLVVGHELWTDAGNKVGTVKDYFLDTITGAVVAYLFISNGWQGITDGMYLLSPKAIVSIGVKRVIAQAQAIQTAEQYSGGLSEKWNQTIEFLREDYAQTKRDVQIMVAGSQAVTAQLQEETQQVASTTQTKLVELTEQLQGQELVAQTQTKMGTVVEQLQDTAHAMATQMQETAATLQTRLEAKTGEKPAPTDTPRQEPDNSPESSAQLKQRAPE